MKRHRITGLIVGEDSVLSPGVIEFQAREVVNDFLKTLHDEADRSLVICACSYIDDLVLERAKRLLSHGSKKSSRALFEGLGPLSSFSARIHLLHCLGEVNAESAADLHRIRKLRNHCAHNWKTFTLDESIEREYLSKMNRYFLFGDEPPLNAFDPRSQFLLVCHAHMVVLNIYKPK